MADQNQGQVQVNWQPVMGGNPYDLIDNKGQVAATNNVNVASVDVNLNNIVEQPIQQAVPQVQTAVQSSTVSQSAQVAPVKVDKWPGGFTKKLVSFLAKLSGQPDPETGKWVVNNVQNNAQNNTAVPAVNAAEPGANVEKVNPFDSIMWWVTGFLDKVEKKVETVAWIDLDASINRPVVAPVQEVVAPVVESRVVVENNAVSQEKQIVENIVEEKQPEQLETSVEVKVTEDIKKSPVDAVKTEIASVEKNENVSVNPISENIQFGESTPT